MWGCTPALYRGLLDGKNNVKNTGIHVQGCAKFGGVYVVPIRMVVTGHIEGKTTEESARPENIREKSKEVIQKLHDARLVFGDLRGRNLSSAKLPGKAEELEMRPVLMGCDWFALDQFFPE